MLLFVKAVPYHIPWCCAPSFCGSSDEPRVCDFHTPLLHVVLRFTVSSIFSALLKMQGRVHFHNSRVFASVRVAIIHSLFVSTPGLLCAVHLRTLLKCAVLSRQNRQPFHVDRHSTDNQQFPSIDTHQSTSAHEHMPYAWRL